MKPYVKLIFSIVIYSITLSQYASASKNSLYVPGKLGASFVSISKQTIDDTDLLSERRAIYCGGSSSRNALNGGVVIGYDFYHDYYYSLRSEFEIITRERVEPHYNMRQSQLRLSGSHGSIAMESIRDEVVINIFMINSYYGFRRTSVFTPYISFGFGVANIKHKSTSERREMRRSDHYRDSGYSSKSTSKIGNNLVWSLGGGGQYAVNENIFLDINT